MDKKEQNRKKSLEWYHKNKDYVTGYRIRVKKQLIEYKGGKCQKCGYNKDVPSAYDFHHRDPSKKEFGLGGYKVLNLKRLKKEADKCDLLCKNCHAELHDAEHKNKREELLKSHEARKIKKRKCVGCGTLFKPYRRGMKYCNKECFNKDYVKVKNKPAKKELQHMVNSMTWVSIGRKYGVSDNAVRKWAKKYGITKARSPSG